MRLSLRRPVVRSFRPSIEALESRCTPATFVYNALTQSLSINAVAGEQITISQDFAKPTGNLQVSSNLTPGIFNDPTGNTVFVKNLSVKIAAGPGGPGQVNISAGVNLAGSFAITTADANGTALGVPAGGVIGGNLTFTSTATAATAADFFNLPNLLVGGSITLTMGSGNNTITSLAGSSVGTNLTVTGAGGNDTVMNFGNFKAGGNVVFNLGAGTNSLQTATNTLPVEISKNFSYTGTTGDDTITTNTTLVINGSATFNVGAGTNSLTSNSALVVGLGLTYTGTSGNDTIALGGLSLVNIGANLTCNLGNGSNTVTANALGGVTVQGKMSILGGTGVDNVTLQTLFISKTLSIDLGDSPAAQTLTLLGSQIGQGLSLVGGNNDDTFDLSKLTVLGSTSITTLAGYDTINIDNDNANGSGTSAFAGPTTLDTGAGNDTVRLETNSNGGKTTFGTVLSILGGADNDGLFLGFNGSSTLIFGGPTAFDGGTGTNTRTDAPGTVIDTNGSPIVGTNGW